MGRQAQEYGVAVLDSGALHLGQISVRTLPRVVQAPGIPCGKGIPSQPACLPACLHDVHAASCQAWLQGGVRRLISNELHARATFQRRFYWTELNL